MAGLSVRNLLTAVTVLPAEFPAVARTTIEAPGASAHRDIHSVAREFIRPATTRPPARTLTPVRRPLTARTRTGRSGRTRLAPAAGEIVMTGAATVSWTWCDPILCPPATPLLHPAATMTARPHNPAKVIRPDLDLQAPAMLAIHHSRSSGHAPMPPNVRFIAVTPARNATRACSNAGPPELRSSRTMPRKCQQQCTANAR